MCDPGTIGIIATVVGAAGSVAKGSATKSAADANASVAEQNAQLARDQAMEVSRQKAREQSEVNEKMDRTLGAQRAQMAGQGVDSSYGSGLDLLSDTRYQAQKDINNLEWNAENKTWQLKNEAINYENQASASRAYGQNAMTQGIIEGASAVAMGAYNLSGGAGKAGSAAGSGSGSGINSAAASHTAGNYFKGFGAVNPARWGNPKSSFTYSWLKG